MAAMSKKLSLKMETVSAKFYKEALTSARSDGVIDSDISIETASFCIDNILLLLQFSYSTEYFKERMKIFAGKNSQKHDEKIRKEIIYLLKKALSK